MTFDARLPTANDVKASGTKPPSGHAPRAESTAVGIRSSMGCGGPQPSYLSVPLGRMSASNESEESLIGTIRQVERGQSVSALPQVSDFDLLGDGEGVVDLDAEISDHAFPLCPQNGRQTPSKVSWRRWSAVPRLRKASPGNWLVFCCGTSGWQRANQRQGRMQPRRSLRELPVGSFHRLPAIFL